MYGNAQRSVHAPFSAVLQAALHGRADERHVAVVLGTDGNIRVEQLFFRLFLVQKILIQQKRRPVALLERLLIEHEAQTVRLQKLPSDRWTQHRSPQDRDLHAVRAA